MLLIGFSLGSIYWDDEDNYNMNGKGGYVFFGIYGFNIWINYCCRYRVIRILMFLDDFKYLICMKVLYMVFGKCKKKFIVMIIK